MKFIVMSSTLRKQLSKRYTSSIIFVTLWLLGMVCASLPIVIVASALSIVWPRICLAWHKAYRAARQIPTETRLKIAHAL